MGLLKSIDNKTAIDFYDYRDQEYYNKYKYRAKLNVDGIRYLYYVKTINQWVERITNVKVGPYFEKLSDRRKQELLQNKDIIEKIIQYKNSIKRSEATVRQEGNTLSVFSNNLDLLLIPKYWNIKCNFFLSESKVENFSGIKYFAKQPKNDYRVYLRSKKVTNEIVVQLRDFIERNKKSKPSKGLMLWLNFNNKISWKSRYCNSSYFIDYDDESFLTYLAICHGELLGRKYKLEKRELPT